VLADSPTGYWRLNESAGTAVNDLTNHGLRGTPTSGVALSATGALADSDAAMSFDGTSGQIQISPNTQFSFTAAFSAEAWIKTSGTGTWQRVVGVGPDSGGPWELLLNGNGVPALFMQTTAGSASTSAYPLTVTDDEWHHIVATWDGTTARLYVDGDAVGQTNIAGTLVSATTMALTFGNAPDYPMWVSGVLDDVAVYPAALSAAQVQAHYAKRTDAATSGSGAVIYSIGTNATSAERTTALSIADATVSVTQAPNATPTCTFDDDPASITAGAAGIIGIIRVTASDPSCTWVVSSGAAWATTASVFYGYAGKVLADGPTAYWRLNDAAGTSAADIAGHSLVGTKSGGVALQATGALADNDSAMLFDGSSGQVEVPYNLQFAFSSGITLEAWVKTGVTSGWKRLVGIGPDSTSSWELLINGSGLPALVLKTQTGQSILYGATTFVVTDDQWHHIVGTWDGSVARIYVDGTADGQLNLTGTLASSANETVSIGSAPDYSMWVSGAIDDVAVYGHGLTATQIADHFALRTSSGTGGSGVVGYTIAANTSTSSRSTNLTVAGLSVPVTQQGSVAPTVTVRLTAPFSGTTFYSPSSVTLAATATATNGSELSPRRRRAGGRQAAEHDGQRTRRRPSGRPLARHFQSRTQRTRRREISTAQFPRSGLVQRPVSYVLVIQPSARH
jgi:uncharacterized membrane protein YkvA (DUF1232 family)